ncbi:hypothetical protein SAMN05444321_7934 [Bradyrhizobium lablabi]|nr:hypothetical protein SAMN05444321_7934 [Bradyrhizobium lablabi]
MYRAAFKASLGFQMYVLACYGFVWAYSLLNLLSAAAVVCAIQQLSVVKFLRAPALCRVGVVSYGVYVYHYSILMGLRLWWGEFAENHKYITFFFYIGIVLIVSEMSFRFLEKPFMSLKKFRAPSRLRDSQRVFTCVDHAAGEPTN